MLDGQINLEPISAAQYHAICKDAEATLGHICEEHSLPVGKALEPRHIGVGVNFENIGMDDIVQRFEHHPPDAGLMETFRKASHEVWKSGSARKLKRFVFGQTSHVSDCTDNPGPIVIGIVPERCLGDADSGIVDRIVPSIG
ncbi:MAG: hypothetical protein ACJAXA_001947 [Candidatus Aldehydirespiratoraceae bacterium]|jgi:hypothetical protein